MLSKLSKYIYENDLNPGTLHQYTTWCFEA